MMAQLTSAFSFRLLGEKRLSGRSVYTLRASRRSGYQPPNMDSRVLLGMEGDLFIDKSSFQWVRVFAKVISPVSMGGFMASVQPGTYFELEKMPVRKSFGFRSIFACSLKARSSCSSVTRRTRKMCSSITL